MRHDDALQAQVMSGPEIFQILDEEIRLAAGEFKQLCGDLNQALERNKELAEIIKQYDAKIAEYTGYGVKALQAGKEPLALDVAEIISELEAERQREQQAALACRRETDTLRLAAAHAESNVMRLKQQANLVKAAQSVQKAQVAVYERYDGEAKLQTAVNCMERMHKRQTAATNPGATAVRDLERKFNENQLKAKLAQAGIISGNEGVQAVLARLKAEAFK